MARYNKKRARELRHDKFRDTTMGALDRLGDRLEGRGRTILYAVGGLVALALLAGVYSWWSARKADEARRALGRAIEIAEAPVASAPLPNATGPTFANERERAERAADEFQKVAAKYGDPYRSLANYFRAANLVTLDRAKGLSELEAVSRGGNDEVAARARFAIAQAREADNQLDAAATIYQELARQNLTSVPADTVRLRLAAVYEKQGKKSEAAELLFQIAKAAREAKDRDGNAVQTSAAAREAASRLQKLDPARYEQLPPEPAPKGLPF